MVRRAVLEVGGVGCEVHIPLSSYDRLPAPGERCRILTYDCVREDSHTLFGFMTEAELDLFERLIDVTGVGPKIALSALSGMTVRELKAAIAGADAKRLSSISGIGRKTAERMILELRDKIGAGEALEAVAAERAAPVEDARIRDTVLALVSLGYKRTEAQQMLQKIVERPGTESLSVEDLVRKALGG